MVLYFSTEHSKLCESDNQPLQKSGTTNEDTGNIQEEDISCSCELNESDVAEHEQVEDMEQEHKVVTSPHTTSLLKFSITNARMIMMWMTCTRMREKQKTCHLVRLLLCMQQVLSSHCLSHYYDIIYKHHYPIFVSK